MLNKTTNMQYLFASLIARVDKFSYCFSVELFRCDLNRIEKLHFSSFGNYNLRMFCKRIIILCSKANNVLHKLGYSLSYHHAVMIKNFMFHVCEYDFKVHISSFLHLQQKERQLSDQWCSAISI